MIEIDDPLLNQEEAARFLGVKSANTLAKWRCRNTEPLKWVLVGVSVRYRRSHLLEYLASQTVDGLAGPRPELHRRKGGSGRPPGAGKKRRAKRAA